MTQEHVNFGHGLSFDISNPINKLRVAASSCFFGEPTYYKNSKSESQSKPVIALRGSKLNNEQHVSQTLGEILPAAEWAGKSPADRLVAAIDAALDFSVEQTLSLAVELRTKSNIRTTPQIIMVRAANHPNIAGKSVLGDVGNKIMSRLDEVMVQAEYHYVCSERKTAPVPPA